MSKINTKITPFIKQCFVTVSVCCSVISACGCTMGFPGLLLTQLARPESTLTLTDDQLSWIASIDTLPSFVGNCVVPAVMARAGRRAAHFVVILLTLVSWAAIILANSFEVMLVGRILQGAAAGMMMPLRSVLVGECSSPRYRGAFLTVVALAQTVGILLVHLIGSFLSYQMTALVSMSFSFMGLLMTFYAPETPGWLAMNGHYDRCRKNFIWLRRQEEIPELDKMILAGKRLKESTKERSKLREILVFAKKKEFYKPIILMSALFSMANCTNTMLVVVYPIIILKALMGTEDYAPAWLVALDFQCIVFSIIAVYGIDKVRRRTLLCTSGAFTAGTQIALAVYVFAKTKDWLRFDSMWIPGFLLSAHTIVVYIGIMPLCSVVAGEVFPLQFRSYCESISLLSLYASSFLVLLTFLDVRSAVGLHGAFALYSGVTVACLAVTWALLPETRGRTLQQIEEHFRGTPLLDPEADKETELLNES